MLTEGSASDGREDERIMREQASQEGVILNKGVPVAENEWGFANGKKITKETPKVVDATYKGLNQFPENSAPGLGGDNTGETDQIAELLKLKLEATFEGNTAEADAIEKVIQNIQNPTK